MEFTKTKQVVRLSVQNNSELSQTCLMTLPDVYKIHQKRDFHWLFSEKRSMENVLPFFEKPLNLVQIGKNGLRGP